MSGSRKKPRDYAAEERDLRLINPLNAMGYSRQRIAETAGLPIVRVRWLMETHEIRSFASGRFGNRSQGEYMFDLTDTGEL